MTDILIDLCVLGVVVALLVWRLAGVSPTGRHAGGGKHRLAKRHPSFETTRLPLDELAAATDKEPA